MLAPDSFFSAIKHHSVNLGGSATAWLAVITANQQQLEYWLRIGSLAFAMVASGLTIWNVLFRKPRKETGS